VAAKALYACAIVTAPAVGKRELNKGSGLRPPKVAADKIRKVAQTKSLCPRYIASVHGRRKLQLTLSAEARPFYKKVSIKSEARLR
jgi:hypothetical protein